MARVWYVKNKPFLAEDRDTPASKLFQANCIRDGLLGMGWYNNDGSLSELADAKLTEENANRSAEIIGNLRGFTNALNCYKCMAKGDVAVTFLNGRFIDREGTCREKGYYYGVIEAIPTMNDDSNRRFTWFTRVNQWVYWGPGNELPSHVQGKFSGNFQRNTVAEVKGFAAMTIKEIAGVTNECEMPILTSENFLTH